MSKVLISALGVGNNDGREYRTAKCFMKDKPDTIETPFGTVFSNKFSYKIVTFFLKNYYILIC